MPVALEMCSSRSRQECTRPPSQDFQCWIEKEVRSVLFDHLSHMEDYQNSAVGQSRFGFPVAVLVLFLAVLHDFSFQTNLENPFQFAESVFSAA